MAPSKNNKSASKSTDAAATTPVEPVVEPAIENVTEIVETEADKYDVVIEKLQNMIIDAKEMLATVKTLKKEHAKAKTSGRRRKTVNADGSKRPASGITKPTELSDELCDFLGLPRGTKKARTDVTKMINAYIKNNKLQDENDRRTILPDKKLQGILLPVPADKKLSFFNMQSFIRQHFKKVEA